MRLARRELFIEVRCARRSPPTRAFLLTPLQEFIFLLANVAVTVELDDPELVGEVVHVRKHRARARPRARRALWLWANFTLPLPRTQTLRILGLSDSHPAVLAGEPRLLVSTNAL